MPHKSIIPAADTTYVRPRRGSQDRITYEEQLHQLEGVVHNDHLFNVYLGECIAPYTALAPLKAALPVHRSTMTMPLNHDDCEDDKHDAGRLDVEALHFTMRNRWNIAAAMFRDAHKGQAITDLLNNLNHLNKLTRQLAYLRGASSGTTRIAYTTSGRPTAAIIRDATAILDTKLYQTECQSEDEANYLTTVLNSEAFNAAAEALMTKGLYGARDFHKHGWKLSIPRYDGRDPLHARLGKLGATAEEECAALIAKHDILHQPAGASQSNAARRLLRHTWQPNSKVAQNIETDVTRLLRDPAQAALAQRQMER